jgi:sigma-B regulation protein RsbU (phosphoserine phosphatase)
MRRMMAESPRLLVVDDNDDNRFTLTMLLEVEGFTDVAVAEDGEQALEALDADAFDLVLLDVMMPRLNGYQVLEALKEQGRLGDPPVIMITALDEIESTVRCIELGAEDYLSKPFNPVLLKARIRASLEKKSLRDEIRATRDRMEAELRDARALQLGLCPRDFPAPTPQRPYDIFAVMEPAREVGGDLYDVFERADGSLVFVVGDVSDKGAAAALFMARTKDIVRLTAETPSGGAGALPGPAEIIARANGMLCTANPALMFVTMFVGMLGPEPGALRFANAGHNDPYRLSPDGEVLTITGTKGHPLGIRDDSTYGTEHLSLGRGDSLFVFSDGITEAFDGNGEAFSEVRLQECLRHHTSASAAELVDQVVGAVKAFTADAPQSDDITAMAVRLVSDLP